ncbi:MAG: penicillin acylase family protein [Actinomycetota bacterium]|nr:penicillin acylase family protein [Actinomycetota bacterium]
MLRRLLPLVCLSFLCLASSAGAQSFPIYTGFRSVLAFGEGEGTSPQALAAFEANGTVPASDLNQQRQYEGLEQAWPGFTAADLNRYYKDSSFQAQPAPGVLNGLVRRRRHGLPGGVPIPPVPIPGGLPGNPGSIASGSPSGTESPQSGLVIVRQSPYQVPRIYGATRAKAMWGAGYATAENRLFFMDVLRHTAEGTTADLLGSTAVPADSKQLGLQDESPAKLTDELNSLPRTMGAEGARALSDIKQYVDGINAFISQTRINPALLPAEYPALGTTPQPWTLADSAAIGVYLIGQFTVFGGQQPQQAEALAMAQRRRGKRRGAALYRDLRLAADPGAVVTLKRRFRSDSTGRLNPRSVAMINPGSLVARNAQTAAAASASAVKPSGHLPAWARRLAVSGLHLPHLESNAVLVDGRRSGTGQALAVMGPQVGYYTPEVFLEYELHAPGINVSGVSFPGSSPYPLIGHGTDFAWTGTSAFSANEDVFAERLCNSDGSKPSFASTHYLYKGRCRAFSGRTVTEQTPVAPTSPSQPQTINLHTLDSVHGPIGRFATVHGAPVALSIANATAGHEAQSYVAFMRLAENVPTGPKSFVAAMRAYTGSENWFYVDHKHIAVLQSGWFPRHARGTNPDLPMWGTGRWDWRHFNPATNGYQRLSSRANPTSIDPRQGYLVNWNNAIAHGWRVAAGDWSSGPVVRATMLQNLLHNALGHRPLTLTSVTGLVTAPSLTSDLRGMAVWPWLRRIIGRSRDTRVRSLISLLAGWARAGSQRRSTANNVVDASPAVLIMDAWWPLLVRAEFQPAVGRPLMDFISQQFNSIQPDGIRDGTGNGFFAGWEMDVQKDLRQVLRRHVRGRFSRTYCGRGSRRRCRALLVRTLLQARAQIVHSYGSSMARWRLPATCPVTAVPSCDQIVPVSAGAISISPQSFDNRGTFYQAVAVNGHRP